MMKAMNENTSPVLRERIDRRTLLKVAAGLLAASVVDLHLPGGARAAMTRTSWVESDVFPDDGLYQSPVFQTDQPFNSIELVWTADVPDDAELRFAVRASVDDAGWTDWIGLHQDSHVRSLSDDRRFAPPVLVQPSHYAQYRVELVTGASGERPSLHQVELGCVDTSPPAQFLAAPPPPIDGWIIPRAGWGADESLRFDKDKKEIWPPEYRPIQKVIVHHTVTQNQEADPAATVRAVYYYHAITQGWGDIGYNFLIDWKGNVYEGRYGGPNVVGGHALQYNKGSLGVAILGTYDTVDAQAASYDSLVRLISSRAANVDPAGIGYFVDKENVPNICGHRDVLQTECPGDHVYARLPDVRGRCKGSGPIYFAVGNLAPSSAKLLSVTYTPVSLASMTRLRVDAVVQNTGTSTIYTQGPPSGFTYTENQDFQTAGFDKVQGAYRLGLDFTGNTGLPNPYRWGLPDALAPGDKATITGFVQLRSIGDWNISASLVQEFVAYQQQNVYPQKVKVIAPPVAAAAQSDDPSFTYEPVTGHNVPVVFNRYWSANGGLDRFGYPLTEPFWEISATDGLFYLTQYFERARFEHHPENAGTQYEVLLGLLGRERTSQRGGEPPFQLLDALPASPDYDYYPQTRHTLRAGFRDYWRNNGGLASFGYPISEEFQEVSQTDGQKHIVQYFERTRFEYHPENKGTPYEVLLGHLGREILIDRGWLKGGG